MVFITQGRRSSSPPFVRIVTSEEDPNSIMVVVPCEDPIQRVDCLDVTNTSVRTNPMDDRVRKDLWVRYNLFLKSIVDSMESEYAHLYKTLLEHKARYQDYQNRYSFLDPEKVLRYRRLEKRLARRLSVPLPLGFEISFDKGRDWRVTKI
jgi:hypothetical protein